jgi:hypothetical protein
MAAEALHQKLIIVGIPSFVLGFILALLLGSFSSDVGKYTAVSAISLLSLDGLITILGAGIWAWQSREVQILVAAGLLGSLSLLLWSFGWAGGFGELNGHENPVKFVSVMVLALTPLLISGLFLLIAFITFTCTFISRRQSIPRPRNSPKSFHEKAGSCQDGFFFFLSEVFFV